MLPVDKKILFELATANVIIFIHDGPYCQINGLAMGSQPAPPFSNITQYSR